jgi:predicted Zn-dependent peptidase
MDDLLARIEGVTMDDIARVARATFDPEGQYTLCMGPETEHVG